ncbi:MAG: ATP-binding protein [Muribaculaceae bacterium]|nr:ATP-binding protein [Muribaculaceae bacterium]
MKTNLKRILNFNNLNDSVFLFGARQTGKTTLLLERFPDVPYYDLLETDTFEKFQRNPSLLRQELMLLPDESWVVIDEIQLIPVLLNEVHWLITRKNLKFVLSGSSARKLRRRGVNTLGGRASRIVLYPLVSAEIPDFDILKAVNNGMLPRHYMASDTEIKDRLQAYISVYLKEEIKAEALVRNLSTFNRFLEIAALTNGEIVNYNNIARECGVDGKTIKEYFSILYDTLIGYEVPAYQKHIKRRLNQAPRFYFFDVAIPSYLTRKGYLQPGSSDFGHAFEHLMIQEIIAYLGYYKYENALSYWHTYSGLEVDAVLGDAEVAIEFKSRTEIQNNHLKGLRAFKEEHPKARLIVVSLDPRPRQWGDIEIMPAQMFLKQLWSKNIF